MGMKFSKEYEAELIARSQGNNTAHFVVIDEQRKFPDELAPAIKKAKGPNKLEQAYAWHLEVLKRAGEIVDYKYESVKLKIGVKTCWYCPDFWVLAKDGVTEYHETKGWMRDDALVKIKSSAFQYPHFRFFLVRKDGKGFSVEAVK